LLYTFILTLSHTTLFSYSIIYKTYSCVTCLAYLWHSFSYFEAFRLNVGAPISILWGSAICPEQHCSWCSGTWRWAFSCFVKVSIFLRHCALCIEREALTIDWRLPSPIRSINRSKSCAGVIKSEGILLSSMIRYLYKGRFLIIVHHTM